MAGTSLLALIDDIATLLDDIAVMTKVAARKTAGVLGDDLALNAQQVAGVRAEREIPVVWAVAKGSLVNKAILVPAALVISALAPWAIIPLLMLGGAFLCFEGFEKIAHSLLHSKEEDAQEHAQHLQAQADPAVDLVQFEKDKIKGAIRTDFILSAEIIVITLGTVAAVSLSQQLMVLTAISMVMTVGVYGLVAGIVKLDDAGFWLLQQTSAASKALGRALLWLAPWLMKALSVLGTAAMFLVGGSIVVHGVPWLAHGIEAWLHSLATAPMAGAWLWLLSSALDGLIGVMVGALVLLVVTCVQKCLPKRSKPSSSLGRS